MDNLKQLWLVKVNPSHCNDKGDKILLSSDAIKVKQIGHYIGTSTGYRGYRGSEDKDMMKKIMDQIQTITSNDLKSAKALYRFPNLSLSRDKVKILQEKFNLKLKRDFHEADYGIVSTKYFDKLFTNGYMTKIDVAEIRALADTYKDCMEDDALHFINAKLDFIPENTYVCIDCEWFSTYHWEGRKNLKRYDEMCEKFRKGSSEYHYYIESLDQWNNIQENISKLVWDSNINDLATEDSEILTEDHYNQLQTMLGWQKNDSGTGYTHNRDPENLNVALAMIANCNIKESHTYLALLFAFLSDSMKDSSVWTTVNFRSVRKKFEKYINLGGWNWGHSYEHMIKDLIEDEALTEFAFKQIAEKMFHEMFSSQFGLNSKTCFTISPDSIQLKPEFKERMKGDKIVSIKEPLPFEL